MRDAIPDRVDVHEGVERHATAQALCPPGNAASGNDPRAARSSRSNRASRRFTGRPMATLIGENHPLGQVLLERTKGVERLIGQRIALDVFDAASVLPLVRAR